MQLVTSWILFSSALLFNQRSASFVGSQIEVFSELMESLMFDVIKTDHPEKSSNEQSEIAKQKHSNTNQYKVSRRRRFDVSRVESRKNVTTELNPNKAPSFFRSKKIVSKQRRKNNAPHAKAVDKTILKPPENNVQSRLEKVKELFEMIKLSRSRQKHNHDDLSEKIVQSDKRDKSSGVGDNENDVVIEALPNKERSEKQREEALQNLLDIAGNDWVKNNIHHL